MNSLKYNKYFHKTCPLWQRAPAFPQFRRLWLLIWLGKLYNTIFYLEKVFNVPRMLIEFAFFKCSSKVRQNNGKRDIASFLNIEQPFTQSQMTDSEVMIKRFLKIFPWRMCEKLEMLLNLLATANVLQDLEIPLFPCLFLIQWHVK
jgi:hypothetical protein